MLCRYERHRTRIVLMLIRHVVLRSVNINMDSLHSTRSPTGVMWLAVIWSLLQWSHTFWRWDKTARPSNLSHELCFTNNLWNFYSVLPHLCSLLQTYFYLLFLLLVEKLYLSFLNEWTYWTRTPIVYNSFSTFCYK